MAAVLIVSHHFRAINRNSFVGEATNEHMVPQSLRELSPYLATLYNREPQAANEDPREKNHETNGKDSGGQLLLLTGHLFP